VTAAAAIMTTVSPMERSSDLVKTTGLMMPYPASAHHGSRERSGNRSPWISVVASALPSLTAAWRAALATGSPVNPIAIL